MTHDTTLARSTYFEALHRVDASLDAQVFRCLRTYPLLAIMLLMLGENVAPVSMAI